MTNFSREYVSHALYYEFTLHLESGKKNFLKAGRKRGTLRKKKEVKKFLDNGSFPAKIQ